VSAQTAKKSHDIQVCEWAAFKLLLSGTDSAVGPADEQGYGQCVRCDRGRPNIMGAYIVDQCQFQLNTRWRDKEVCRNWNCIVGIPAGEKSYTTSYAECSPSSGTAPRGNER
jgi:hypothetical protein